MGLLESGPSPLLLPYLLYSDLVQNLAVTFPLDIHAKSMFLGGNKNKVNLIMIITFFLMISLINF